MSIGTIIIISITAGIHIIGLGLFLLWMAAGSPMSIGKFKDWLKTQPPFRRKQLHREQVGVVEPK